MKIIWNENGGERTMIVRKRLSTETLIDFPAFIALCSLYHKYPDLHSFKLL